MKEHQIRMLNEYLDYGTVSKADEMDFFAY
jgi:hypothetical protein